MPAPPPSMGLTLFSLHHPHHLQLLSVLPALPNPIRLSTHAVHQVSKYKFTYFAIHCSLIPTSCPLTAVLTRCSRIPLNLLSTSAPYLGGRGLVRCVPMDYVPFKCPFHLAIALLSAVLTQCSILPSWSIHPHWPEPSCSLRF